MSKCYKYVTGDALEQVMIEGNSSTSSRLEANTLCWVLQNKGKTSKTDNVKSNGNHDNDIPAAIENRRTELFLPARVVSDSVESIEQMVETSASRKRRVLIRYAQGSTYRVRRCHLLPVLEPRQSQQLGMILDKTYPFTTASNVPSSQDPHPSSSLEENIGIVLVVAETHDYRRTAVVHTCHSDLFLEIGCDLGTTVHRVQRALQSSPPIPLHTPGDASSKAQDDDGETDLTAMDDKPSCNDNNKGQRSMTCQAVRTNPLGIPQEQTQEQPPSPHQKYLCYGVDKAEVSISQAQTRFPESCFSVQDALEGMPQLLDWWQLQQGDRSPTVVAIDINGTRPLPAVQTCLAHVMKAWQPRLVVVKSRELYAHVRTNMQSTVAH